MSNRTKLDRIDIKILAELQRNGNITNANLAAAVGLSASPCLQRVKRLEATGVISGYGAHVNVTKLTSTVSVFTEIMLHDHRREDFVRFEANLRDFDEITECHLVSGGYDYLLKFVVKDIGHYQDVIERLLDRNLGIEKYFSYIVIRSPFVKHGVPLEKLLSDE
ncbi:MULTISPECIES: Lrp/AsnC family transcriptional regulator [Burkholderia cepacia complex]|uniref:Lrp/AsnC family transcriptional regulator n=1 Tax=Burkholderia aenigmatica TaxID=2015348 RepID=A0A228IMW1_9BURK|nr:MULTISPECIES: Lrp/AsnC family transcriptional regulator [Burkholderia cepacia complex]AKM03393.1 AsnC family transcriptional regulator [Burkholderia pyrrocinia]MBR8203389.1 Lrp/AsnC family transcriptional regulator [Burkholderia vietnamiensis]MBR8282578.1 Lrp/AsnC family transcriptional regulator [Burkholderia vietnamiensis]MCA8285172.1 Lrp/AsnC family transcriptional regulator [Burkholderia cepacia]MDN8076423.1 Lrp/AsnC family transcriptional regulator [Burkholderia vietnamiensis]